jgi:N-acetylmuramoyl-L-alanine amidase
VLKFVSCPAVLIEAGFLSNDAEARRIGSAAYRDDLAAAIAAGIRAYDVQLIAARR